MVELTALNARCYVCGHLISGPTTIYTDRGQAHPSCVNCSPYAEARIAEMEAEVERLTKEAESYRDIAARKSNQVADMIRAEALSRTGAVKVKALEWEKCHPGVYISSSHSAKTEIGEYLAQSRAVYFRGNLIASASGLDAAKAAAQADYERRILSALEPAATCNESLQVEPVTPEGQQPVARPYAYEFGRSNGDGTYSVFIERSLPAKPHPDWPVKPLYTRPSEQAVTEAMVEAAAKSLRPDLFTPIKADVLQSDDYALTCRRNAKIDVMGKARAALKAALAQEDKSDG